MGEGSWVRNLARPKGNGAKDGRGERLQCSGPSTAFEGKGARRWPWSSLGLRERGLSCGLRGIGQGLFP